MRPLFTLLFLLLGLTANAQKENYNWCFGNKGGIDFNTNPPTTFTSGFNSSETTADISNRYTGKLMFYTDGEDAYDATHSVMQNGNDMGFAYLNTTAKGAVIVPFVNDTNKFYVFTLQFTFNGPNYDTSKGVFGYSVVDMTLNGGLGGVVPAQKKIPIDTGFMEGMAAVEDDCGNVWVLLVRKRSNEVWSYKVTPYGIIPTPVVSTMSFTTPSNGYSQIRVSPDRKMIALNIPKNYDPRSFIALMQFDYRTGRVSNDITITTDSYHCSEFSPDSKKLYASGIIGKLVQYDLSLYNASVISASEVTVTSGEPYFDMMRGPDGNIYCGRNGRSQIDRISNCNALFPGCVVTTGALILGTGNVRLGFPANVRYPEFTATNTLVTSAWDTVLCTGQLTLIGNASGKSFLWNTGSTAPSISVSDTGLFWVFSFPDTGCITYIDTFDINETVVSTTSSTDTLLCSGKEMTLQNKVSISNPTYKWDNSSTDDKRTIQNGGTYWVKTSGLCRNNTDTFHVEEVSIDIYLTNDTAICKNTQAVLRVNKQPNNTTYLWSTGAKSDTLVVSQEGLYNVTLKYRGCEASKEVQVSIIPDIGIELGLDTQICRSASFQLPLMIKGGIEAYTWSTGDTTSVIGVRETGKYFVNASNICETVTDTVDIKVAPCYLFFPSAFSPNRDGLNDYAKMTGDLTGITDYDLRIFNRWGQVVFSTTNPAEGWNGMFNASFADIGVYFYQIRFTYFDEPQFMKGTLQLVR
ncbi:MAG: gliding motility-associated C-terminal domain-containing protein [Chitinophagaceae bacterium]|nr:gliding motility-associated C-terminal domain-containing protein [Chitinophagaceae bacterium]